MTKKRDWTDLRLHGKEIDLAGKIILKKLKKELKRPNPDVNLIVSLTNSLVYNKVTLLPIITKYLGLEKIFAEYEKRKAV